MKLSTTEEFIIKINKIHNNKYDYSIVNYINNKTKIEIICKEHGIFEQKPNNHLNGQSCPKCSHIKISNLKRLTTEEFIERSNQIHNNKYDYSKVNYINVKTKIKIICKEHGIFEQRPNDHLNGKGCKLCSFNKKSLTIEEFIKRSNQVHDNKYNYSSVDYINSYTKVKIICPEHGMFEQIPNNHLNGNKCSKCSHPSKRSTTEEFITKANEIHNNKYDYSKLNYINAKTKVNIICSEHGMFEQILNSHLDGKGCKKCAINKQFLTIEEFIKRSNQVHDNKYDYSLSNYKNNRTKIKIICKKHGKFNQKVNDHLNGSGCSICNSSKGELKIINFLKNNNIKFETQKTFNNCKYKRLLPFDFYLPEQNILIEYDGEQHYGFGRFIDKSIHLRDEIKDVFAFNNGYKMLRIPYTMFDDIEKILKNI